MIKIRYPKKFNKNDYYEKISKRKFIIKSQDELKTIDFQGKKTVTLEEVFNKFKEIDKDNFNSIFKDISFKDLLIGNFETLQKIKQKIKTNKDLKDNESIRLLFNYDKLQKECIHPFFENNLKISTCYYCNIDYVNSYNVDRKKNNKFTLDHFYDKSTYPYLALSLYNLIPSCYTCNSKLKKAEEFDNLSPSSTKYDFDQKVKFKLFLTENSNNLNIKDKNNIKIMLKENYSSKYNKYIEIFKLNERYNFHKDIVFDMMKNAELYPESRLKELQNLTGIPYQQIKQNIFKLIDDDTDLSQEPFSKLKKDIAKELGLT